MLRQHIHREDHVLFPMALHALSPDDLQQLLVEFQRADEKAGENFVEKNEERVQKMAALLVS